MNHPSIPVFYSRHSLHVEIYDAKVRAGWSNLHADMPFYLTEARSGDGPILELACGTGRVLLSLCPTGRELHGLDASAPMLKIAGQKRDRLSCEDARRVHLHQGDMAQFSLETRFSLVIVAFRSFQALLTPESQRSCLECIHRHLVPGGRAILNLFDPRYDLLLPGRQTAAQRSSVLSHPASGREVRVEILERDNEPVSQTFRERWRFTEFAADGAVARQEEEELRLRWTFRPEMRHLAERSGFAIEHEYSDFLRSAPAYGREQIWVLRKP